MRQVRVEKMCLAFRVQKDLRRVFSGSRGVVQKECLSKCVSRASIITVWMVVGPRRGKKLNEPSPHGAGRLNNVDRLANSPCLLIHFHSDKCWYRQDTAMKKTQFHTNPVVNKW